MSKKFVENYQKFAKSVKYGSQDWIMKLFSNSKKIRLYRKKGDILSYIVKGAGQSDGSSQSTTKVGAVSSILVQMGANSHRSTSGTWVTL